LDNELNKNDNVYDATLLDNIFNDLNNYYSMFQTAKKLDTFSTAYQTTLLELHNEFLKRKRELNFLDFSDLNHLAIKALTKIENGNTQYTYYTDKETYLMELKKSMENKTWSGYTTFTPDASVRQKADDMLFELYGRKNPCSKERYEEMQNWRTESVRRDIYCSAVYIREMTKETMEEYIKSSNRNNNGLV